MLDLFPANDFWLIAVILGTPLLGAFVNGVWGRRLGREAVRAMALGAIGASFLAAVIAFFALHQAVDAAKGEHARLVWNVWTWMHTTGLKGNVPLSIDVRFSIDALSGVMMLVVTGVGFLIHLYATSYMWEDPAFWRFFCYLNLFIFAMLVLILGDNLPLLFVGWEGVGLCSYLLIGFWYTKDANASAGMKAFIANRIGDFGIICAMFLLAYYCGALDWKGLEATASSLVDPRDPHLVPDAARIQIWPVGLGNQYTDWHGIPLHYLQPANPVSISAATAVGLALLLGCTGKSAQIPLYVWLPDAMAGPTPVSALIHAATMVTAGVYLVCRLSFVFVLSPFTMTLIACVGAATALVAATIALTQNDIKKVLAYSTVSQLGFMFLGVGVGAFTAGFFHVFTHAFFKACLFLGAGSVIHAMHARIHDDDKSQDIRFMGGLKKYMPITRWTFLLSTLAIIGCPLTSGFFSKDEILFRAFVDEETNPLASQWRNTLWEPPHWIGPALYVIGLIAATMTAFYMVRLYYRTFEGDFRGWTVGRPSLLAKQEAAAHDKQIEHEDDDGHHHEEDLTTPSYPPRESPKAMTYPLIILAAFAVLAGVLNPGFHVATQPMEHWLEPVFDAATKGAVGMREGAETLGYQMKLAAGGILAFAVGGGLALWMYHTQKGAPAESLKQGYMRLMNRTNTIAIGAVPAGVVGANVIASIFNKGFLPGFAGAGFIWAALFFFGIVRMWQGFALPREGSQNVEPSKRPTLDDVYEALPIAAVDSLAETAAAVDSTIVDGLIARVTAAVVAAAGTVLRAFQNGVVHVYAAMMVVGLALVGAFFVMPHANATVAIADPNKPETNDFKVQAGPGMGYLYRWDADNDGKPDGDWKSDDATRTIHLDPQNGKKQQLVNLEVANAFGFVGKRQIAVVAPEAQDNGR